MNIEDILPELFYEKRVYYCQRCLNHGLEVKRKNHKAECTYRYCVCNDCQMVDRRRELNSRLLQFENVSPPPSGSGDAISNITAFLSETSSSPQPSKGKERRPNCQRCAQHSVMARLKGHKRCCPFRDCSCAKCQVVQERQKLMADQIKLRRRQKKQKILDAAGDAKTALTSSADGSSMSVCMKCTQQTLGYQQLLSYIDPNMMLNPNLLTAILAVCPHTNQNDL